MKRMLSVVLALTMVLSLMTGICLSVGAEEYTLINEAVVTGDALPELAVGDTLPELSYAVEAGANYTVDAQWVGQVAGAEVQAGEVYTLRITLTANDAYAFSLSDVVLRINGEDYYNYIPVDEICDNGVEQIEFNKDYPFMIPVEKVEISYAAPQLDKALSAATVPAEANYTVSSRWYEYILDDFVADGAIATKEGCYAIAIDVAPADGYQFNENTEVWVNGELLENPDVEYDCINYWSETYALGDPIGEVGITYAEPVVGQKLPVPQVVCDKAELEYYYWYDYITGEDAPADALAEKGHRYELCVTARATSGYKFADETKFMVNGAVADKENYDVGGVYGYYYSDIYDFRQLVTEVTLTADAPEIGKDFPEIVAPADAGYVVFAHWYDEYTWESATGKVQDGGKYELDLYVEPKEGYLFSEDKTVVTFNGEVVEEYCSVYEDGVNLYRYYSFAAGVDKIEINYEVPQVGKAAGAITIPQNVHYSLGEESGWYDYNTGEKVTGKFEDGKRYELRADVNMEFGYETSEDAVAYLNGEKYESYPGGYANVYVYESYSFAKAIAKVELPAWPNLEVGGKLPEISGTGEHYSYYLQWYGYDADGNELTGDTAEDGAVYYADIYAYPDEGYEFLEETKVTVGGKKLSALSSRSYGYIEDRMIYSFGAVKLLNKVELTTDIPGYGEKGGEVKIAENAGCSLGGILWGVSTKDDYDDAEVAAEAYKYGDHVLLMVELLVDDGYLFAPDAVVTINGKEYELVEVDQSESSMMVLYDLGEITKPAATPATGDTTPVMLLSFLCLSTLAGIGILLSKKRIAR